MTTFGNIAKRHFSLLAIVLCVLMSGAVAQSVIGLESSKLPFACGTACKVGHPCATGCVCTDIIAGVGMCKSPN